MRFVLLGDMHVFRLYVQPWQLLSKRLLGQTNLWLNRRLRFRMSLFDVLVQHAVGLDPDMLLGSGDVTTTSLPSEFIRVRHILEPLTARCPAMIVPGNHDRYTDAAMRRRTFERVLRDSTAAAWPHHRQLGQKLHLIALDIAAPTWLFAGATMDQPQLDAVRHVLSGIEADAKVIVICHYPLQTPPDHLPERPSHAFHNAHELTQLFADSPQQFLYLHGHVHEPWCFQLEQAPNVVALNAGAPVMIGRTWPMGQGLWEIASTEAGWDLTHHARDAEGTWHATHVATPDEPGQIALVEPPPER